jgi:hypothetical protein
MNCIILLVDFFVDSAMKHFDQNMLARRLSATKNKYVSRRCAAIKASLKNNLNPRSEITAIWSHLSASGRASLKKAILEYNARREAFLATGKTANSSIKSAVETSGNKDAATISLRDARKTAPAAKTDAAAASKTSQQKFRSK